MCVCALHNFVQAVQEWALHKYLLHDINGIAKDIHVNHHDLPYHHICIDDWQLAVPWGSAAIAVIAVAVPQHLCISVMFYYFTMGLTYEFVHYLSHTRVNSKGWLKAVKQHHMKHHLVDDSCFYSFTAPVIDTLMRTDKRSSKS
jgi:hypothetical protein